MRYCLKIIKGEVIKAKEGYCAIQKASKNMINLMPFIICTAGFHRLLLTSVSMYVSSSHPHLISPNYITAFRRSKFRFRSVINYMYFGMHKAGVLKACIT